MNAPETIKNAAETFGFWSLIFFNKRNELSSTPTFTDAAYDPSSFNEHYTNHIFPLIKQCEKKRLETLNKLRPRMFIAFAVAALLLAVPAYQVVSDDWSGMLAMPSLFAFFGLILVWFGARLPIYDYQSSVANSIYPDILKFYGDEFNYVDKSSFFIHSLDSSGIIPTYDKEKTTHKITGSHNNIGFVFAHTHLSITTGSSSGGLKDEKTTTVFSGVVFLLSLEKTYAGNTIIHSDEGRIGNWFAKKQMSQLTQIPFENTHFEKSFEVYSENETEARRLLSERLIQRLLELEKQFDGKNMTCSFYENKLLIMVKSKKSQVKASSIYEPATFMKDITTLRSQINDIFQTIDTLDLEQNTYHL